MDNQSWNYSQTQRGISDYNYSISRSNLYGSSTNTLFKSNDRMMKKYEILKKSLDSSKAEQKEEKEENTKEQKEQKEQPLQLEEQNDYQLQKQSKDESIVKITDSVSQSNNNKDVFK